MGSCKCCKNRNKLKYSVNYLPMIKIGTITGKYISFPEVDKIVYNVGTSCFVSSFQEEVSTPYSFDFLNYPFTDSIFPKQCDNLTSEEKLNFYYNLCSCTFHSPYFKCLDIYINNNLQMHDDYGFIFQKEKKYNTYDQYSNYIRIPNIPNSFPWSTTGKRSGLGFESNDGRTEYIYILNEDGESLTKFIPYKTPPSPISNTICIIPVSKILKNQEIFYDQYPKNIYAISKYIGRSEFSKLNIIKAEYGLCNTDAYIRWGSVRDNITECDTTATYGGLRDFKFIEKNGFNSDLSKVSNIRDDVDFIYPLYIDTSYFEVKQVAPPLTCSLSYTGENTNVSSTNLITDFKSSQAISALKSILPAFTVGDTISDSPLYDECSGFSQCNLNYRKTKSYIFSIPAPDTAGWTFLTDDGKGNEIKLPLLSHGYQVKIDVNFEGSADIRRLFYQFGGIDKDISIVSNIYHSVEWPFLKDSCIINNNCFLVKHKLNPTTIFYIAYLDTRFNGACHPFGFKITKIPPSNPVGIAYSFEINGAIGSNAPMGIGSNGIKPCEGSISPAKCITGGYNDLKSFTFLSRLSLSLGAKAPKYYQYYYNNEPFFGGPFIWPGEVASIVADGSYTIAAAGG